MKPSPTHIPRTYVPHPVWDRQPRVTVADLIFWIAVLIIFAILGSLKAAWWQIGLTFLFVLLVRVTSRREVP